MHYVCSYNPLVLTIEKAPRGCEGFLFFFQCFQATLHYVSSRLSSLSFRSIFITPVGNMADNMHGYKAIIHK